jgi:hypothetical protein
MSLSAPCYTIWPNKPTPNSQTAADNSTLAALKSPEFTRQT